MSDPRANLASTIAMLLKDGLPHATVEQIETTSGCPVVRIKFPEGDAYNITITRSRS